MTHYGILATLLLICSVSPGWADSKLMELHSLDQNMFRDLTADLGTALGYKAISPGQPLGSLGFDLGFEVSSTRLDTHGHDGARAGQEWLLPGIHLFKGLPYGIDVGGFYSSLPASDIALMGGELGYALINGHHDIPDVSIRGTYTQLTGVQDLSLSTRGLELSVSKGFDLFTPYAGIGTVWIDGDTRASGLVAERLREDKYFMGFSLNLGDLNFAAETEQTGDSTTTSATFGARF